MQIPASCASGTYLNVSLDACIDCPPGSWCAGGASAARLCSRGGEKRRSNGSSALHLAPNRRSISSRPPRPFGLLSFGTFQPICSRSPMQDMP